MTSRLVKILFLSCLIVPVAYAEDVYRDCINLVTEYAFHRDRYDAERFASLFTEDASLTVGSQTWNGRDNIRQRIEGLDSTTTIRHLMSTIRIVPVDELHATGVSYATIYTAGEGSSTTEGFAIIGEYHDEFVLTEAGWKIENRVLHPVFSYDDQ